MVYWFWPVNMQPSGTEVWEGVFKGSCFSETAVSAWWESCAADGASVQEKSRLLAWEGRAALLSGVPSQAHTHECLFAARGRQGS